MKKLFIIFLFIILSISFLYSQWKDDDYDKFTIKTFTNYTKAKKYIDFTNIDYELLNAALFYYTNIERKKYNLKKFKYSKLLSKAAFDYAKEMVKNNFFSHYHPYNNEKHSLKQRLTAVEIRNAYISENIARNFGIQYISGKSVFTPVQNDGYFSYNHKGTPIPNHTYLTFAKNVLIQWMNSPMHRKNILAPDPDYLGCGTFFYEDSGFFNIATFKCVQNFSSIKGY